MKKKVGLLTEVDWKRLREEVRPILEEIVENTKPKWADRVLTAADKAAGDYKKFDEEKTVLSGQVSRHSDDIEDLKTRTSTIEKHLHLPVAS